MHLSPQDSVVPAVPTSWTHVDTMETMEVDIETMEVGSEGSNGQKEPWNQEYLHSLFDDQRARLDDRILEQKVTMENFEDFTGAGLRAITRLELGLKPAPKASALGLTTAPKRSEKKPEPKKTKVTKSGSRKVSKTKRVMSAKKNTQKNKKSNAKKTFGKAMDETLKKKLHSVSKQHFEFSRTAR